MRSATYLSRVAFVVVVLYASGPQSAAAQSVASLFTTLPSDFGHLFTPTAAIPLGIAGAAGAAIHPKDDEIAEQVFATEGSRERFFHSGKWLGDIPEHGALALGMYIVGRASGNIRMGAAGADLIDAQIVNGVITKGLKYSVNRDRPNGSRHSFPSGHTSVSFATAAVMHEHYGWKIALPFYALGVYVAGSRMVSGDHYASDVLVGAGVGLASGRAAAFGHGARRVSVSPSLTSGGVAIFGTVGQ